MTSVKKETESEAPGHRYTKWLALAGAILIFLPDRFPTVWGNMAVYVTSYFYNRHGNTSVASTWTLASYTIGASVGSVTVGYIALVGRKKMIFLAILVFNAAVMSMYFTLKYGFAIMIYVAFSILGICSGMISTLVFKTITQLAGSSKGKYISIACSGYNFGPAISNSFVGFYMNPENIPPSFIVDGVPLFNEQELIVKVPSLVVTLTISYFVCMMTGFLLLFFVHPIPPSDNKEEPSGGDYHQVNTSPPDELKKSPDIEMNDLSSDNPTPEHCSTLNIVDLEDTTDDSSDDNNESPHQKVYTTKELLKNIPFYVLSFSFGVGVFPSILLFGSYKTYGLIYTENDHLLTALGTLHPLVGGIIRIPWGFVLDNIRAKICLVSIYAFLSFSVILMFFAPVVDINLYFIATLLVALAVNTVVPTFLLVAVVYFGEESFCKSFALLKLSRFIFGLIISPLFEELSRSFGWCGPFFCVSSLTTISLVLLALLIPDVELKKRKV